METTNNFITDLLDDMLLVGATTLLFIPGSKPSMQVGGVFRAVPGYEQISGDELLFDLESLGIIVNDGTGDKAGEVDWKYTQEFPVTETELRFSYSYAASSGKLILTVERTDARWIP
jgi:hypothetical protein